MEQELGEALSAVAASVLPCSLALLVLRSPLGWKNTQTSVTRSQLWWEALAEIQLCAAFGLGSSLFWAGFVCARPLTRSCHGPKPSEMGRGRGQGTCGAGTSRPWGQSQTQWVPHQNPPHSSLQCSPGALGAHGVSHLSR